MGNPLLEVAWDACLLEPNRDREAEAYLKREAGSAPAWARYFFSCPWVPKAMIKIAPDNGLLVALDFPTTDLISLVVSQEHSCRYCYAATRSMLRVLGMSEERMQRLEQQLTLPELEPRQAAAVRYARRLARANPRVTPADQEPLRQVGYRADEIREIAFVVACVAFMNRVYTIPALPPQSWEGMADQWAVRLFRPLLAHLMKGWRRRGQSVAGAAAATGAFSGLIRAFEGSPIGPVLADILRDLWSSPLLSRRSKALMFAVIGRGLGCEVATAEACGLLRAEGLSEGDVAAVLSHLGGAGLDPVENALLMFARETIWYEPAQIQRRARQLHGQLAPGAFVEAVGVAALANSLCRLADALVERS